MSAIRYEPAIDGLRAIAIGAVLLFHLAPNWLPGGFCGVDVFFVISGYLITSIQLAELEAGTFQLSRFYQRRIARIFPALLAASIFTLLGAVVLYDAQDRAAAGAMFTAVLLSVANMKVMLQGNYFHISQDTQPFMHFWSLSLEEQFYAIFPAVLLLWFRLGRKITACAMCALIAASFVACVALTHVRPTWAFFLLPARGWELLCGCLLAHQLRPRDFPLPAPLRFMLQLIGLVGLAASFLLLNESLRFPGALAAIPVMATVVFIAGIHGGHGFASRLLSQRFPVFVGRLSYSLYLWHWPINSFVDYAAASQNEMLRAGGKVALTMALSLLSFYVIESPFRKWLAAPAAGWTAIGVVVSAVALSPLGITINREGYPRAWLQDLRDGGRVFNRGGQRGAVALYGDSIAASFAKVVIEACVANDCECQVFAVPGGNPVPKSQAGSDGMWEQAVAAWRLEKPSMVIVAIAWLPYLREDPTLITTMVDELRPLTRRIVLLSVAPELPVKEVRAYLREGGKLPLCEDVERSVVRRRINANLRELVGGNVTVIDVDKYFVDPAGVMRVLDTAGNSLFHDQGHLAYRGTLLLKQAIWNEIGRMPEKPVD